MYDVAHKSSLFEYLKKCMFNTKICISRILLRSNLYLWEVNDIFKNFILLLLLCAILCTLAPLVIL